MQGVIVASCGRWERCHPKNNLILASNLQPIATPDGSKPATFSPNWRRDDVSRTLRQSTRRAIPHHKRGRTSSARSGAIQDSRALSQGFFRGTTKNTATPGGSAHPGMVHHNQTALMVEQRQTVLDAAYRVHPNASSTTFPNQQRLHRGLDQQPRHSMKRLVDAMSTGLKLVDTRRRAENRQEGVSAESQCRRAFRLHL